MAKSPSPTQGKKLIEAGGPQSTGHSTGHQDSEAQNHPSTTPNIRTLENPLAPEMFVAEAHGFFIHMGNVHITFATPRVDHGEDNATINRAVVGRVVMPVATAQSFAVGLYDFLSQNGFTVEKPRPKDLQ